MKLSTGTLLAALTLKADAMQMTSRRSSLTNSPVSGWGFDTTGMDTSVRPGDDFFRFASGKYIDSIVIPDDRTSWGPFDVLAEDARTKVKGILESDMASGGNLGKFYKSFLDEDQVEELNLIPLNDNTKEILKMSSVSDFAKLAGKSNDEFYPSPFDIWVEADPKDPDRNTLTLGAAGLGLPDRDYYTKESFAAQKQAYGEHIAKMLTLMDWESPSTTNASIIALEEKIAEAHWPRADLRDPDKTYNLMKVSDLKTEAPGFDWQVYLDNTGPFPADADIIVGAKSAVTKISAILAKADVNDLKAWTAFHMVSQASAYLPERFNKENFKFFGKTLSGQEVQSDRWKRGVSLLNSNMGDAVGQKFVDKHFPPASKVRVEDMTQRLKRAFRHRIRKLTWMSPETKARAQEKLRSMDIQVGYPKKFRSYDDVVIDDKDLLGNVARAGAAEWRFWKDQLSKPVDRDMWFMSPQTVNAYNMPNFNMLAFPAAILQPPFFNPDAEEAVNFGSIGAVIGHEMTHGFDDEGRKYDATGALSDWWTAADEKEFSARAKKYGDQFAKFTLGLPAGAHINPDLTMGENLADLGGVTMALTAYHQYLKEKQTRPELKEPMVSSMLFNETAMELHQHDEGVRRLFLGYAQVWREKVCDDTVKQHLVTDPHPPATARVMIPLQNLDLWYSAFDVSEDAKLYLKQDDRVSLW